MDNATLPFSEEQFRTAGPLGDSESLILERDYPTLTISLVGLSNLAARVVKTMQEHPELLKLDLFTLECIDFTIQHHVCPPVSRISSRPTINGTSSTLSVLGVASNATAASQYTPDEYERIEYYNGVTESGDQPVLVYRSDFLTRPFPKPTGRFAYPAVKSIRGVFDTSLNKCWEWVGPQICDLIKARNISASSVDPARFFTHGDLGGEKGTLGPVVIWIGVIPGSTSADVAHDVSQEILDILQKNGVDDAVVEWREAVWQRLAGPPLMRHVSDFNPTHYVRRFLTPLLDVPIAAEGMDLEEGTLTLWFHKGKNEDGSPSDEVLGLSNCHVLRKDTTVRYKYKDGASRHYVRVCGMLRFQRAIDEIRLAIGKHGFDAELWTRRIARLEATERKDPGEARSLKVTRRKLEDANEAIMELQGLYDEVTKYWSDIKNHRNIGHVVHAEPITVDTEGGTRYTSDWGAFLAAKSKVDVKFEGNVVDLGSEYTFPEINRLLNSLGDGPITYKYLVDSELRIEGCATKDDLAKPDEFDAEGQRVLIVGKSGNTTDLTVGVFAGLESFVFNEGGIVSAELGIYNSGAKNAGVFSDMGDSGSGVWYIKQGKAHWVGQLHSGSNGGGSTAIHITYCTPMWYVIEQVKKVYPHADFYRTRW